MKGISLFMCEQVLVRTTGTFDVLGAWLTNFVVNTPLESRICLYAHIAFEDGDVGDHVLKLMLIDPAKKEMVLTHTSIVVEQTPFDWRLPLSVNARFERPGLHKFALKVDKKKLIETPVWIHAPKGSQSVAGFQPAPQP